MRNIIIPILLTIFSTFTIAQINITKIGFDYGYTNNYQREFGNNKLFALSPEIKIGGDFFKQNFEWDFLFSYWDDGIKEPFSIRDAATYSYSSKIIGFRLNYYPPDIFLPLHFISGLSFRFVNEKYIGGADFSGNRRENNTLNLYTLDFGTGFDFRLIRSIRLRIDALASMPLNKQDILQAKGWSNSIKLGLDYIFK